MDLVSLLITFIGIILLLGLFVMSRFFDETPVKQSEKSIKIPLYTDAQGNELSSVMADFPAPKKPPPLHKKSTSNTTSNTSTNKNQFVLFIASQSSKQLDGNAIISTMEANELKLGLNDIYHYYVKMEGGEKKSLFSIANGVAPWTLKNEDLADKSILGLSMIMQKPTAIKKADAVELFVTTGEKIAKAIGGELQNTQQQLFLQTDKEAMLTNS